jgi:hypothetical protein
MPIQEEPRVGAVYEDAEGKTFEVIGVDEDEGNIEIRYVDDAVDEIDIDTWYEMELQQITPTAEWDDLPSRGDASRRSKEENLDTYVEEKEDYDDYESEDAERE